MIQQFSTLTITSLRLPCPLPSQWESIDYKLIDQPVGGIFYTCDITVIVIESGLCYASSNLDCGCMSLTWC